VGYYWFDFIVVVAAGVEVAVVAREVAAAYLDAKLFAGSEVSAGLRRLEGDLVDLVFFHEHGGLVVAFAVADALDIFVYVVGGAVGEDFDELEGEVSVFGVAGNIERELDGAGDFKAFGEWSSGVDENVVARLERTLIDCTGFEVGAHAAESAAACGDRIHGIVEEFVGCILGWRCGGECAIAGE